MPKENLLIEIPEEIRGTDLEKKVLDKAARVTFEQAVLELYKAREISTETGAKMLGMSLWEFIPWLGQHDVSIFNYTDEEVAEEMRNVDREHKRLARTRKRKK